MIGKIGVVIDSAAYLPQSIVDKYLLLVAPLSVELDGERYLEGVDITADEFYERLPSAKSVSTSQPAVGRFMELYRQAAETGAEEVLSIHIGSSISGTVQSARLASGSSSVPVTVVDTGQASFAEGLCVLEGIQALVEGKSATDAAVLVGAASRSVGNTFVVKAPTDLMAGHVEEAARTVGDRRLRVGVGHGAAQEIAAALRARIAEIEGVEEVIEYVVGPAVGAHTGAGTAGAVYLARPVVL